MAADARSTESWASLLRCVIGGVVGIFSFGSIMLATRLDKVGEAAILRETSTVFGALIGWYFFFKGTCRSLSQFSNVVDCNGRDRHRIWRLKRSICQEIIKRH